MVEVPPYLTFLETVLVRVRRRDGDLLHGEERARLEAYDALSLDARRLLVRLLTRKGPWFRRDDLRYAEVEDLEAACGELVAEGWCREDAEAPELAGLLTKDELATWLGTFGLPAPRAARREALAEAFASALADAGRLAAVRAALCPLARLHDDLWALVFLLFFGTFDQDLSLFIRTDIGQLRCESYPLEPGARRFEARADVDFLRDLRGLREGLEAGTVSLAEATALVQAMEARPGIRAQRRFSRLLNDLGRDWERAGDVAQAEACYVRSSLPPARERRVRVRATQGDLAGACALAVKLAEAPLDTSEAVFATGFLRRQARKVGVAAAWAQANPPSPPHAEQRLVLPRAARVEDAVLEAARVQGWEGFFSENVLWHGLFAYAFWDLLFAPVPGAFIHPFQGAPLDIDGPGFYEARREGLEARLAELRQSPRRLLAKAEAKAGLACSFVNPRHLTMAMLEAAVDHVPPEALCGALATLARHPRAFDSGFPDLFLYGPEGCALWEVKGPGDTLRPEQDRWLRAFRGWGVAAEVVRVAWLESGT